MMISEVTATGDQKLVALSQYLVGRAGDTGAKKTISIDAFISLAQNMGVSLTPSQLRELSQKPPLKNVIVNITDDEVVFSGADASAEVDTMTVKKAQDTVEKMAKRALDQ